MKAAEWVGRGSVAIEGGGGEKARLFDGQIMGRHDRRKEEKETWFLGWRTSCRLNGRRGGGAADQIGKREKHATIPDVKGNERIPIRKEPKKKFCRERKKGVPSRQEKKGSHLPH